EPSWVDAIRSVMSDPGIALAGGPVTPRWETEPPRWLRAATTNDTFGRRTAHGARREPDRPRGGAEEARRLRPASRQASRHAALGRRPRALHAGAAGGLPRGVVAGTARHALGAGLAHARALRDGVVLLVGHHPRH